MADMDMYLVWESASSALNSVMSGAPRLTTAPSSTCTLVTMPAAIGVTLTSRYALAITLPGAVTAVPAATTVTGAVLIPARASASGESTTSASPAGSAGAGGGLVAIEAAGARIPSVRRSATVAPAAPSAIR